MTIYQRPLNQAIIHDITHRKRLEEERIKSTRLETITLMACGIAHDFNNLLGVILGYLDMAQSETDPGSETSRLLARMEKASRSAVELVSKFRNMSERGSAPKEVLSIGAILGEAVGLVLKKSIPAGSRVECNLEIAPDVSPVKGYRAQLRRVFENIAVNALEAVGDNGKIRVSAANIDLSGDEAPPLAVGRYVTVIVADNGAGIPAENLAKIFDPYFTTRGDSKRAGQGMGLAVAESIIKRHDGAVKVSSELGKGTTFFIYLPVVS
jgi:signal transduction histidine kinase